MNNQHARISRFRSAFTVVEMLVVIGILVVVSLGVATIFQSVGETVSRGRKLSQLNQFAARIERVMRQDFESMTRDGFLVIVNKNAGAGRDIQLYRGEELDFDNNGTEGRARRSDEIMFFARGDFVSQRRPIVPSMIATSNEAAIYYGHGQKRRPQIAQTDPGYQQDQNLFFNPEPWDNNFDATLDTRVGSSTIGFVNPNEFARDWSLLRHVTLLTNPQGPGQQVPKELFGFNSDNPGAAWQREILSDSARQVMLQPAARSIFKSLNGSSRQDPATGNLINRTLYDESYQGQATSSDLFPLYMPTSGLVDIVTQDIASIRTELQALATFQPPSFYLDYNAAFGRLPTSAPPPGIGTRDLFEFNFYTQPGMSPRPQDGLNLTLGQYNAMGTWNTGALNTNHARRIRNWMIDALPSAWSTAGGTSTLNAGNFFSGVRYEDTPTRLLYDESDFDDNDRGALERAYAEANQEMLGSSVFVPRCTEFIVEWSYGFVNNASSAGQLDFKELTWYGLNRIVDSNNSGQLDFGDRLAAQPYWTRTNTQAGAITVDGLTTSRPQGPAPQLVVGRSTDIRSNFDPSLVEFACFGFGTNPSGSNPAGAYWPWPKLIRITMSLGDPTDPDIEETYQVIFEVPELE
ncbi:MAG: hypothetical protein ACX94C_11525 [Phycisphaerales bacterium]